MLSSNWALDDEGESLSYRGPLKEYVRAANAVFRLLRRYRFCPMVIPVADRMIPRWAPLSGPGGRFKRRWPPIAGEYDDVQAIYELTRGSGSPE